MGLFVCASAVNGCIGVTVGVGVGVGDGDGVGVGVGVGDGDGDGVVTAGSVGSCCRCWREHWFGVGYCPCGCVGAVQVFGAALALVFM